MKAMYLLIRKRMQDSKTLSTRQDGSYMLADDGEGNLVDPIKIYAQVNYKSRHLEFRERSKMKTITL